MENQQLESTILCHSPRSSTASAFFNADYDTEYYQSDTLVVGWCSGGLLDVLPCFRCFGGCADAALAHRLFLAAAVTLLLELWNLPWS